MSFAQMSDAAVEVLLRGPRERGFARGQVERDHQRGRGGQSGVHQEPARGQDRVAVIIGADLRRRAVRVAPGRTTPRSLVGVSADVRRRQMVGKTTVATTSRSAITSYASAVWLKGYVLPTRAFKLICPVSASRM